VLFNSLEFLLFFPLVVIAYYVVPYAYRWLLLLIASYVFYGSWRIEFLSLIALSTIVDFNVGKRLHNTEDSGQRIKLLLISLVCNLGLLVFFKYGSFIASFTLPQLQIPQASKDQIIRLLAFDLPVGISFYTFQTMGYTIDIFKRKIHPEKHLGKFALYVSYFPQLVAGPIERFSHLQPQLFANHLFKYENLSKGFRLMLYGFFIKMVIADNIAPLVDAVFADPLKFEQHNRWLSIFGFGWQIYADFYGYSLIAIGTAQCMGIELIDNFKTPYFARSIQDFWRRWHISLSTWFRDYVFVPLGGSQVNKLIWVRNILVVFVLSGIWHGANYTFMLWGALHGLFYLMERFIKVPFLSKVPFLGWIKTYLLVSFCWVFFRAADLSTVGQLLNGITPLEEARSFSFPIELSIPFVLFLFGEFYFRKNGINQTLTKLPFAIRWSIYSVLLFFILVFSGTTNHPFIYFQF